MERVRHDFANEYEATTGDFVFRKRKQWWKRKLKAKKKSAKNKKERFSYSNLLGYDGWLFYIVIARKQCRGRVVVKGDVAYLCQEKLKDNHTDQHERYGYLYSFKVGKGTPRELQGIGATKIKLSALKEKLLGYYPKEYFTLSFKKSDVALLGGRDYLRKELMDYCNFLLHEKKMKASI